MLTNGSTAIECGGGSKPAGRGGDVALTVAGDCAGFGIQGLLIRTYASAARTSAATAIGRAPLNGRDRPVAGGILGGPEAAAPGSMVVAGDSGDSSRRSRATNSGCVAPP